MSIRMAVSLLLVLALLLPAGCVYYNTFYHAKAAARQAELMRDARPPGSSPGPNETELLERVIEKSGRVLQLHPDSGWADDALLLLGSSYYYQGRYESAEERLNQFISLYPDSELRPEAEYMLASVLLAGGNPTSAERLLQVLAHADPPRQFSDDALALIGRARHDRGEHAEAAEAYTDALERFPKSEQRAEIRFLAAENYVAMGDLDAAASHYELVQREPGGRTLAFEARMRLAEVDLERGLTEGALAVLDDLRGRTEKKDDIDRVLLLKGRALENWGALDDAIETYEGVAASHPRSETAAEAHYRIGLIHRDRYENFETATEVLRQARDASPRSDAGRLAAQAIADIDDLKKILAEIDSWESAPVEDAGADSSALMEDGASPGETGRLIDEVEDETRVNSDSTPQELAPSGPGTQDPTGGTAGQDEPFTEIVLAESLAQVGPADLAGVAPDSALTAIVATEPAAADSSAPEDPDREIVEARFRAAELYLLRFEDPDRALGYYRSIPGMYPGSGLAPKAALAAAWVLDEWMGDAEGAEAAYRSVLLEYPDTEYAGAASDALSRLKDGGSEGETR